MAARALAEVGIVLRAMVRVLRALAVVLLACIVILVSVRAVHRARLAIVSLVAVVSAVILGIRLSSVKVALSVAVGSVVGCVRRLVGVWMRAILIAAVQRCKFRTGSGGWPWTNR